MTFPPTDTDTQTYRKYYEFRQALAAFLEDVVPMSALELHGWGSGPLMAAETKVLDAMDEAIREAQA